VQYRRHTRRSSGWYWFTTATKSVEGAAGLMRAAISPSISTARAQHYIGWHNLFAMTAPTELGIPTSRYFHIIYRVLLINAHNDS
jgi:hypothetical protein